MFPLVLRLRGRAGETKRWLDTDWRKGFGVLATQIESDINTGIALSKFAGRAGIADDGY